MTIINTSSYRSGFYIPQAKHLLKMSKITQIDGVWVREANLVNHHTKNCEHLSFHGSDWETSSLVFTGSDARNEWGTTVLKTSIKCNRLWQQTKFLLSVDWRSEGFSFASILLMTERCKAIKTAKVTNFFSGFQTDFHQKWAGKAPHQLC